MREPSRLKLTCNNTSQAHCLSVSADYHLQRRTSWCCHCHVSKNALVLLQWRRACRSVNHQHQTSTRHTHTQWRVGHKHTNTQPPVCQLLTSPSFSAWSSPMQPRQTNQNFSSTSWHGPKLTFHFHEPRLTTKHHRTTPNTLSVYAWREPTAVTGSECAGSVFRHLPFFTSQIRTLSSNWTQDKHVSLSTQLTS